ncbi:kynurenine formamidase isoform 6 [Homo sapiens]|uniref:kynurenine formamidase isoform 6 n=1 Tax=Homo sapiens TaxID=9606 RepID=UPI0005CFF19D|nr:kynurenine formamidase isoform 6 [Homo sapiens]|eukprot:XP_011522639.1 kynurenine formamidase isoform X8 [Homo sapiens]
MMDVSGVGFPSKVPWKKMSAEELENQYCPSRWVVRLGAEEALRTYSQIGIEATTRARATRKSLLHVPYGDGEGEKVDIYFPDESSEALPFFLFFHGGYWQSGRHPGPHGRPGDPQRCVCPEAVSKQQTLCQGEWKASFEELHDVDHFEIVENLTQKDNVLTQIILKTIFQ